MLSAVEARPRLWPTLFAGVAMMLLLGLGTWQLQRLDWKTALIAERTTRTSAAPIALPRPGEPVGDRAFRRSRATGTFLHERELYLGPRTLNGVPGYQLVTPLRLPDGGYLLVNRGWVPADRTDPATRPQGQVSGPVTVAGILRESGSQGLFTPDNEPARNLWFWPDLPAMATAAGLNGPVVPLFLEADASPQPGGLPIGGQTQIALPNNHLQYAITWYALALALAVIFVLSHRRAPVPGND